MSVRNFLKAAAVGCVMAAAATHASYNVNFYSDPITSWDGTLLHCDGYIPQRASGDNTTLFPLIIFPNSWVCPTFEYIVKAQNFAQNGYITLEYETRGWYNSGGTIDTAGPLDQKDGSSVIDFALSKAAEWNINTSAIAFAGISYGAGISLLMAGTDPRVKTAVALSGWVNITTALYPNHSPSLAAVEFLVDTARLTGRPSQELINVSQDLSQHKNIDTVLAFAAKRSAIAHLDVINARKMPIFISNNMFDRFFDPMQMLDFYTQLQGPKFMLLNQGEHAEPEMLALIDIPGSYIWGKVRLFLDDVLKGINTGIFTGPTLQIEMGDNIFSRNYQMFDSWPSPAVQATQLIMGARGGNDWGALNGGGDLLGASSAASAAVGGRRHKPSHQFSQRKRRNDKSQQQEVPEMVAAAGGASASSSARKAQAASVASTLRGAIRGVATVAEKKLAAAVMDKYQKKKQQQAVSATTDTIEYSTNTDMSDGIPIISDTLASIGIEVYTELWLLADANTIVYRTEALSTDAHLCGTPAINVSFTTASGKWQIYSFMYDVDAVDLGRLISDGEYARWDETANTAGPISIQNWEMRSLCTTVPAGHRIGLGFVMNNKLYASAETSGTLTFTYLGSSFSVPLMV
jgi:predicted acyl esterase